MSCTDSTELQIIQHIPRAPVGLLQHMNPDHYSQTGLALQVLRASRLTCGALCCQLLLDRHNHLHALLQLSINLGPGLCLSGPPSFRPLLTPHDQRSVTIPGVSCTHGAMRFEPVFPTSTVAGHTVSTHCMQLWAFERH